MTSLNPFLRRPILQLLKKELKKLGEKDIRAKLTLEELVDSYGLVLETHKVTTSDGYILVLHRIYSPLFDQNLRKPVVFMQHGMYADSAVYMYNGDQAAAFRFAWEGYDVWLGNNRGNRFSIEHVTLNPKAKEDKGKYYDYSFYEMGTIDIPTMIDYVIETTNVDKLTYVGHS